MKKSIGRVFGSAKVLCGQVAITLYAILFPISGEIYKNLFMLPKHNICIYHIENESMIMIL